MPEEIPLPRIHAEPAQWELIAAELYRRGLVEPAGKYLEDDRQVLRFIMDFRGVNAATRVLTGDVGTLTGAAALQHIVLPEGKVLRVSADDLVAAFYLFALPPGWSKLMCFNGAVQWKSLGIDRPGTVLVGARVLPMGWASAVGVLQHAHRRLALRQPISGGAGLLGNCEIRRDAEFPDLSEEDAIWSLYLDDTSLIEQMDKRLAEELEGKESEEQLRLRKAYAHWGIPVSFGKALVRSKTGEKLGAVIHGELGHLRAATKRALETMGLGFWLLRQEEVSRKSLQVFVGREVHTMQFRRPTFSLFDYIWKDISDGGPLLELSLKSVEEILMAGCSQPLRFTDLRARLNEVVTCSDASESGGGMVYGNKLTTRGLQESVTAGKGFDELAAVSESLDSPQQVIVFDCFAGIGGLSRALQLAEVNVARLVVIEKEKSCRRLNSVRFPGADVWTDIKKVTKKDIEKVITKTPGATGVIAGGGSPCQGLSRLSANRIHLEDERSKLLFDLVRVLGYVQEICKEKGIWCVAFVENVEADEGDVSEMSEALDMVPVKVCSSHLSRVRRPRLFWANIRIRDHPCFTRSKGDRYDELLFEAPLEPLKLILDEGWRWKGAESDEALKLPTFTRAIPWSRPPAAPAGIHQCNEETLGRWRQDRMKFPPYTYLPTYLFESCRLPGYKRDASANERERLMGFRPGHTRALFKKDATTGAEKEAQEVERQAALGNSFHAIVMACLVDMWLWSWAVRTDPLGPRAIVERWHRQLEDAELGPDDAESLPPASEADFGAEEDEQEALQRLARQGKKAEWLRLSSDPLVGIGDPKLLGAHLVYQYLRRMEFRGSDIRLDLQVAYRPDAVARTSIDPRRWVWDVGQSYPWKYKRHINFLELQAILRALEWRARSSMSRSIRQMATKAERKQERQKIGRLGELKVSPNTLARYEASLREVATFARLSVVALLHQPNFPEVLKNYIEFLWEEGDTKSMGSYALASLQFHQPQLRGQLAESWRLLSLWGRYEQPRRATPLSPEMLFAFAGVFLNWGWPRLAWLSVVGFCGLLRTGELFLLKRRHVVLPRSRGQSAVLFLEDTKTAQRNMHQWEKVLIPETVGINALKKLCAQVPHDGYLAEVSPQRFRDLWKQVVAFLGLAEMNYIPYSLRRGGATSSYRNGMSLDQLVEKGRWKHIATARLYLDQGLQEYAALTVPPASQQKIRAAQATFQAAGLGRVER
eukprot:Skav200292  [mRNA]  locus=scaffold2127:400532:404444:+ [translate_table: standard]